MRFDALELPPTADFHSHLRDGAMMETVISSIRQGGVDTVLVLWTIAEAALASITGVKVYPAGVTMNSDEGVIDFRQYYPVFEARRCKCITWSLNLHGEKPNSPGDAYAAVAPADFVTTRNAEEKFLPTLRDLHSAFPTLRIVLEHCSTREALYAVRACGPTVAATITAHHLWITQDDWCGNNYNFCKPVAKDIQDRVTLVQAAAGGEGNFFFGSDSAPHPACAKNGGKDFAAGCFTQGYATALVVEAVEEAVKNGWIEGEVTQEVLEGFLSGYGRKFYEIDDVTSTGGKPRIVLERKGERISEDVRSADGSIEVVPFRSGEETLSVRWKS
ncbi:hypothetical protein MMC30_001344 [Trapelia coarctata]|nr:hypothetical protein [Trapelia coarctata]